MGFDTEWRPTMCRAGTDERFVLVKEVKVQNSPISLAAT